MTPKYIRNHIPFFSEKSEGEFRVDPYERYDEMVVRQTALHLADKIWGEYPFQKILDWVSANIPAEKNKNIIDLGCGVGRLAASLARQLPESEIWGLDYSYQMLRRAHEFWVDGKIIELDYSSRGVPLKKIRGEKINNLKFGLAKAEELPFENNSQDIITHTFLFDRLKNPGVAIQEMHRVLRPNGYMIMVSPLNFQFKNNWEGFHPIGKTIHFLQKSNWKINCWMDDLEVKEPLDVRGNFVAWKCMAIVAKKK